MRGIPYILLHTEHRLIYFRVKQSHIVAWWPLESLLVELVHNHVSPPPSAVVQRFHFNYHTQDGKTVGQFVVELCRLSQFCEFGSTLNGMLWDHLVCGTRLQSSKKIVVQDEPDISKAFELAKAAELAEKSIAHLQHPVDAALVHAVRLPTTLVV